MAFTLFEFATQLSISTDVRTYFVKSDTVAVPRLRNFNFSRFSGNFRDLARDPLANAGPLGFYSSTGQPDLRPRCPSENCDWPIFSSVGVCSKCLNIADQVRNSQHCTTDDWTKLECNFGLDHHQTFQIIFGYNGNGPGTHFNASAFFDGLSYKDEWAGISNPISSFLHFQHKISHLGKDQFQIELLEAAECAVYVCVKTYNISVVNGISHQDVISTWYNGSKPQPNSGSISYPSYLDPPNLTNNSNHRGPYVFSGYARDSIANFIPSKFNGFLTISKALNIMTNGVGDPAWIYAEGNVSKVLENVALAFTDAIQTGQPNREEIFGEMSNSEIYVHVRWLYLALPIALAILSTLFLSLTIYGTKSSNVSIWKSSSLVLLYHGLEYTPADENNPLNELSEMNKLAGKHRVRLQQDEGRAWKLI